MASETKKQVITRLVAGETLTVTYNVRTNKPRATIGAKTVSMMTVGAVIKSPNVVDKRIYNSGGLDKVEYTWAEQPASEPAAAPESEPAAVDAPRYYCVGEEVTIKDCGHTGWIDAVDGDDYYVVTDKDTGWYESHELEPAPAEPATDARPIDSITEARLIDSITEARIDRQRLENENASLTSQFEALKVRFAELEAEYASLKDECEYQTEAAKRWAGHYAAQRDAMKDARRVVIAELQAAIDAAPAGFRQAAIEQYFASVNES